MYWNKAHAVIDKESSLAGILKLFFCVLYEIVQDMCASNPCLYDGTCFEMDNNTFKCLCVGGWKGEHCHGMLTILFDFLC